MTTEKSKAIDEAQIRTLIDHWAKALRAKDINGLMSHYAPDILTFDIVPPLQCQGVDVYRKNFEAWFASVQGPNEDSPQQATGYQKENRLLMRNHGFSNSSL
jgi:ketosteroid isomerase-like protein